MIAKLEETRRRLLDLTRSNRLLNHRDKGLRTLQICDEIPAHVYDSLVIRDQQMQFLSREEASEELAQRLPREEADDAPSGDPAEDPLDKPMIPDLGLAPIADGGPANYQVDRYLQTLLVGEKLQTRLVRLAREAASAMEEQGYNILYLTLGMVEWCEAGSQAIVCRAPLVFVPVDLQRKNVQSRHAIHVQDEDIFTNPCLVELCQRQFAFELPVFNADGDLSLDAYFQQVEDRIRDMPGWRFLPEIHLGLFSFAKLLMYRDLDPKVWPADRRLTDHALIRRLSGFETAEDGGDGLPDPNRLDDVVRPNDCYQVLDADSSQQAAILAAKRGVSLVIQGPPGTGKSQTITNIIGECLAEGKTVLFVAEKSAALEVVKRRLETVGLGDFVLELHSRKASKRLVHQELQRVLAKQEPRPRVFEVEAQDLEATRRRLNEYHHQLHQPLGGLEISPFRAISHAIALRGEPEAICQIPDPLAWTRQQVTEAEEKLQTLDRRLARVGDADQHPWRGVGPITAGVESQQAVVSRCQDLRGAIGELLEASSALTQRLGVQPIRTIDAARTLLANATTLLRAPSLAAATVADSRWNTLSPDLQRWLGLGLERTRQKTVWSAQMRPEAEALDWRQVLYRRRMRGRSVFRFLLPSWHRDTRLIRAQSISQPPASVDNQIRSLESLVRSSELRAAVEAQASRFANLFGEYWHGMDSDWAWLQQMAEAAVVVRQMIVGQAVDQSSVQRVLETDKRDDLGQNVVRLTRAIENTNGAWTRWLEAIKSDDKQWLRGEWADHNLDLLVTRLDSLPDRLGELEDWVDLCAGVKDCRSGQMAAFVEWALGRDGQAARGRLARTFQRHFFRLWVDRAFGRCPALQGFRGEDHERLIERFCQLDMQWLKASRHRLGALIAANRPDMGHNAHKQSKLGILQAEIRKKARHMPLRKLLASVGDVVQSIKPCFMMSPISVAQYLAPGCANFDVVVFDEASQVEPADAYGAIARGTQAILVGDEKQLPPTSFFSKVDTDDSPAEAEDIQVGDLESILALGIVRFPSSHQCSLRWHYRSRHSSLIEFSNQKFYDGYLRVFPSPHTDCRELGLAFHFVEGGIYMRGSGRHNPVEALEVARAVIRHALQTPELSLGVGTLNLPQRIAIEDELERLRRTEPDPRVEEYFARHIDEPFFVKNLENIQGDERDVIYLSIGRGKDSTGRVSSSFGALNSEGGWRRLNVLITRARRRCVVFTSIRADDLNLGSSQARGVVALKEYLDAAEHGRMVESPVPAGDHESQFEVSVCRSLQDLGWEVHSQVGCAGFSIDLAVVDPHNPGRYLLGIECDGATYHSSATARDRDRLRQEVLEGLGWTIHRIWSTDWFLRPRPVLDSLQQRLRQLADASNQPETPGEPAPPPIPAQPAAQEPQDGDEAAGPADSSAEDTPLPLVSAFPDGVVEYRQSNMSILGDQAMLLRMSPRELAGIISSLVEVESPIHIEEVLRRTAERFSTRASLRSRQAFDRGLAQALAAMRVERRGDFLWVPGAQGPVVRHRGSGCPVLKPELIAPEEYAAAIKLVLTKEFGLSSESLVQSTIRLMGFRRTGATLKQAVEQSLRGLMDRREVVGDNADFLVLASNA